MSQVKVSIEQPYFFPYLGYFQIINYMDKYVIYDDVNYIKRGWVNRNFILTNGSAQRINLPIKDASQNKLFSESEIVNDQHWKPKFLKTIQMSYSKAPFFKDVYPVIERIINFEDTNLVSFLHNSFVELCGYMNIRTELILSSSIDKDGALTGEARIIDICKGLNADAYYNTIGGIDLYHHDCFSENGLRLHFMKMNEDLTYKQFNDTFIPNLSIIDVLMFNSKEEMENLLTQFTII